MNVKQKVVLLVVCLMIFFPLAKTFRKKEGIQEQEKPIIPAAGIEIKVFNTRDQVIRSMNLEEYLIGVVAAEMPAGFSMEALKAQAIAARTYTLGRAMGKYGNANEAHFGAHVCTSPEHCQAWIPKELYSTWYPQAEVEKNWEKIEQAVLETRSLILTYEGEIINPLYHANSGGMTENAQEVWSSVSEVPYLRSVYSEGENEYTSYEKKTVMTGNVLREKLESEYPDIEFSGSLSNDIEVIQYTGGQRVKELRIGNINLSGTRFRELFSLASAQMEITFIQDDEIEITTYGYGHGVGMSQCGANELAGKGKDYTYILQYYYTGVEVEFIPEDVVLK